MTTDIKNIQELKDAGRFFEQAIIVSTRVHWVREARLMLYLRAEGNSFGKIAGILFINTGDPYLAQTVKNRIDWALAAYRAR